MWSWGKAQWEVRVALACHWMEGQVDIMFV